MAVLAHSGTDAGFKVFLEQLQILVGAKHALLEGLDIDEIPDADLYLAFCWVFHQCVPAGRDHVSC